MFHTRKFKPALGALASGLICFAAFSGAQAAYPDQPIRLIVPYPPGGATDVIGRIVGKALADGMGVSVIVDNRGGAAGSIGATEVAKAKPDGYTILLAALTSHAIYQNIYVKNATYDLNKDFQPIAVVGSVPQVLAANPSLKADSLAEFIALAKKNPGKYSIASAGDGSPQQMAAALLGILANIELIQVPYRGSGPAMTDLVGGQVDTMVGTVPSVQAFIKSNKLKALAVASQSRAPTLPDVPTAEEGGLKNFNVSSVFGVLAPAGTPADRIELAAQAIRKSLESKEVQEALLSQGVVAGYQGPADTKAAVGAELHKWQQVIEKAGIPTQ